MLGLILLIQALTIAVAGPPGSPEYLPIRVADAEGYFGNEGLSVSVRPTRAESGAAEALAQRQADLAATSLEAMLRFGHRPTVPLPRLVFGLTAAPPVALLVPAALQSQIRSVRDLAGGKIGITAPGGPEQTWLQALLARAHLGPTRVDLISLGSRGTVSALNAGDVRAALVPEPAATALLSEGHAVVLVDLRSPRVAAEALGMATVNAAIFARADASVSDLTLAAFARALLLAERRLLSETPAALAERLSRAVVGSGDEFERRVEATRSIYLPEGVVSPAALRHSTDLIRTQVPLPYSLKIPRPEDMLRLEPLKRAIRSRPPA